MQLYCLYCTLQFGCNTNMWDKSFDRQRVDICQHTIQLILVHSLAESQLWVHSSQAVNKVRAQGKVRTGSGYGGAGARTPTSNVAACNLISSRHCTISCIVCPLSNDMQFKLIQLCNKLKIVDPPRVRNYPLLQLLKGQCSKKSLDVK